jgi:DNA invertase Pin-like site-specific DNA recombinase
MIGACINQVAYDRPDNNRRVRKSIFTGSMARAMTQMASVFGEQERQIIRSRVVAGLHRVREQGKKLGRPMIGTKVEDAIRQQLGPVTAS